MPMLASKMPKTYSLRHSKRELCVNLIAHHAAALWLTRPYPSIASPATPFVTYQSLPVVVMVVVID